jgi:hypothetical protein
VLAVSIVIGLCVFAAGLVVGFEIQQFMDKRKEQRALLISYPELDKFLANPIVTVRHKTILVKRANLAKPVVGKGVESLIKKPVSNGKGEHGAYF